MPVNYKRLVSLYEQKDAGEASETLAEALAAREVDAKSIDLGRLFEECFGWQAFRDCRRKEKLVHDVYAEALTENQGAVHTGAFLNIIGQIVYSMTLDAYNEVANVFTPLIPEQNTAFLDGEKIAGVTEIGDEIQVRDEGNPYAIAGVGENWIFTPSLKDRGLTIPVTWEALFADRTGQVQTRCADVGKWGGRNREKRAIDCVIDENTTAHRYNWRGTVIATYGDNSGSHSWDNLAASNGLVDWLNVNTAEQNVNALTDPFTGEVVDFEMTHLVVTKQLEQTARRIVRLGTIKFTTPGYATSGNVSQHAGDNPYAQKYEVVTSKLLAPRLATDTDWFLFNPSKYARYMVAEKANVTQAPSNSHEEFHRRIVQQYRFNERGAYTVIDGRAAHKSTA